jgi:heterotetrameric sarcosine oxidase delta subunit
MLQLNCPWCGPRDETEYHYGGQAHVPYPADPGTLSDQEWAEYLFYRDNPMGPFAERWVHSVGCRRWFNVVRDTRTYDVLAVYTSTDQPPAIAPAAAAGDPR